MRDAAHARASYAGLWQAAAQVATPHLRNMGTLGGNLCLDTRCTYYDQNYEWRKAIDFCMKKDGDDLLGRDVEPEVPRGVVDRHRADAASRSARACALVSAARRARASPSPISTRTTASHYLTRRPDEILTDDRDCRDATGWRSAYWKLRRRGSFDFPVLSVAAAAKLDGDGTVEDARIVLGAVASRPLACADRPARCSSGSALTDDVDRRGRRRAPYDVAKPMDNTDFELVWRKRMVARRSSRYALRELRGDDVRELRQRIARQTLS